MTVQFSWVGRPSCGKVLSSLNAINTGKCLSLILVSYVYVCIYVEGNFTMNK